MANKLAAGLSQISQGFAQIGNAFEYRKQVEDRKDELALRKKQFELDERKFNIAEREVAFNQFGELQKEYLTLENENKSSANDWLKMEETQTRISELAPKMGMSVERAFVSLKNESDFFRSRRASAQSSLTSYAATIKGDAPEMAAQLELLSQNMAQTRSKEELETLMKDSREFLSSAFAFQKQKDFDPSAISVTQFFDNFKEVGADVEGAQKIKLKDGSIKFAVPKQREVSVSTAQSEDVRKSIASQFGIPEQVLKFAKPDSARGQFLPDIDELTSQAEQRMKAGSTPQKAIQEVMGEFKNQNTKTTKQLEDLMKKSPEARDIIRKRFKTNDLSKVPFSQKRELLNEILGGAPRP